MQNNMMIALSAATVGIAITGILSAFRGVGLSTARARLAAVFSLFAGIVALPLVVAFMPELYVFYMPLMLPMLLGLPPTVYLYVDALASDRGARHSDWRHGILPLVGLTVAAGFWLLSATQRTTMLVEGALPPGAAPLTLAVATFALIVIWMLASFGYLLAALKRLGSFRRRLRDVYSNVGHRELRWIDWLMGFLVVLWGAAGAALLSDNLGSDPLLPEELVLALTAGLMLFLNTVAPITAPTPEEEPEPDAPALATKMDNRVVEKYARSALSDDLAEKLAVRIEAAMRDDQLYLDPNLSLQKLSRHVGGAQNMVSQTLNARLGSSFFDYVAHWRIEAAKPLICAGKSSILNIAMDVGFNSKSTFYKMFKKETGMTPKAFREASADHSQRA